MSYISCENSALIQTVPSFYPVGSVGYTFEPVINVATVASGTVLQPMASLVLPKGVWAVTGTLHIDVGSETMTGNTGIAKDGVVFWRSKNETGQNGISITLSAVISSSGSNALTIPMTYVSSGATAYGVSAAPLSEIQVTRIA
jgi:hypothetical protein